MTDNPMNPSSDSEDKPFDYDKEKRKLEALEIEVDNAYDLAHKLQERFNKQEEKVTQYEQEQAALDW